MGTLDGLKHIYDIVRIPVVLKDAYHTIVYANQAYADLLGRDLADLIGTDGVGLYGVGAVEEFKTHDRHVLTSGEEYVREFELRPGDLRPRRVRITKKRVHFGGEPYVFGVVSELDTA